MRQIFIGQPPFDFLLHIGEISDEYQRGTLRDLVKVRKDNKVLQNVTYFFTHDFTSFLGNLQKKNEDMILCSVGQKSINAPVFLNSCDEVMNLLAALAKVTVTTEG